ncbi:hypothetical protein [Halomonas sp. BMC6]|uniref:hypothetical protein n=1 Tax=Halomonas sp. BMC6 TaxID=3073244 RepID=UPI0030D2F496
MSDNQYNVESIQIHNIGAEPPFKLTLHGKVTISSGTSLSVRVEPTESIDGLTVDQLKDVLIAQVKSDLGLA